MDTEAKTLEEKQAERARYERRLVRDREFFSSVCQQIRAKSKKMIPFIWNSEQKRLHDAIIAQWKRGLPAYIHNLKARQYGGSTYATAHMHRNAVITPNYQGVVMAHDDETTTNLWNMIDRFDENLPVDFRPENTRKSDANMELEYKDMGSMIKCHTAGNAQFGRSFTLNDVLLSEAAFYPKLKEKIRAVQAAFVEEPGNLFMIETTANGMFTYHWDLWEKAEDPASEWVAFFSGAWDNRDYRRKLPLGFKLTQEEEYIRERILQRFEFKTPLEYFAWRRAKIASMFADDLDGFHQEYPEFPEDAFISSGRGLFNKNRLSSMMDYAKSARFALIDLFGDHYNPRVILDQGPLKIHKMPRDKAEYVIGVDVAEGVKGGDYSVCQVFDKETGLQVAVRRERCEPVELAFHAARLGFFFNEADIEPENNSSGRSTVDKLREIYPNEKICHQRTFDEKRERMTKSYGFRTTASSKITLIDFYRALITEEEVHLFDIETIKEHFAFERQENGSYSASEGKHDDCVMAAALAFEGRKQRPYVGPFQAPKMIWVGGSNGRYVPEDWEE